MNDDKIRSSFQNLRRDAATQVSARDGLDRLHRRNQWWRRAAVPAFGAAVIVLVAVGAFAVFRTPQAATPVATTPVTVPTTPPTTPLVPDRTPDTTPDTIVRGTAPDTPAGLPAFDFGDVLVAGDESLYSWDGETATLLLDAAGLTVVGDLTNGIIYTHPDALWWIPNGSFESQLLHTGRVELHAMALVDGQPTVIYTESGESDTPITRVHLLGLYSGEDRVVYEFGPMEGGLSRVSFGGGLLALTAQTDGGVYFDFATVSGEPADVTNPLPGLSAEFTWADQALLSPDAATLVYLTGDESRTAVDLVAWDMATGVETDRVRLNGDWPHRIRADFDGTTVVISQQGADGWAEPLRFEYRNGTFSAGPRVGIGGAPSLVADPERFFGAATSGCSAGDGFVDEPYGELPGPVADTRAQLIEAASSCSFTSLDDLASQADEFYRFFELYKPGDFAANAGEEGNELPRVLLDLVNQPFGTLDGGAEIGTIYVWPRAATYSWAEVTEEDLDYLRQMGLGDAEFEGYRLFGDYVGYRIGITADGDWLNIAAGD